MGLTETGFARRTYNDILNAKIEKAKELFGQNIDTSEFTPLGKFIRINAYDQALAEEEIEAVYYARFPNTASGTSLDRLLVFVGIQRNPAEAARYTIKITGEPGFEVPIGFLVGTKGGVTFYTDTKATIDESGTCVVTASCTEAGEVGNVNVGDIDTIVNPDVYVTAIAAQEQIATGKEAESDAELRKRFKSTIQGAGSCNEDAIRAALLRVPTVEFAAVIANNSTQEDGEGRPPHSFECYVLGGDGYEKEIAETIFGKKPIGIKTVGDNAVEIVDASGNKQTVRYSNTQNVRVTVSASVKADNTFPADGLEQIRKSISNYINSLGIDKDVVRSSLYGHIYAVPGVTEVTALTIQAQGGESTEKIVIPAYGVAVCGDVTLERVADG